MRVFLRDPFFIPGSVIVKALSSKGFAIRAEVKVAESSKFLQDAQIVGTNKQFSAVTINAQICYVLFRNQTAFRKSHKISSLK